MSNATATPETSRPDLMPVVRYYLFAGSIGLLVLWLALFERGFELFSLIPVLLGALGLAPALMPPTWRGFRLFRKIPTQALPLLVVFLILPLEILFNPGRFQESDFLRLSDVLLIAGLLIYLVAQYRLIGLRGSLVPIDERPRADRLGGDDPETRSVEQAKLGELKHLLWLLPVSLIAGQLLWQLLLNSERWNVGDTDVPRLDIARTWWRVYVLIWILCVAALLVVGGLTVLRLYRLTRVEAVTALQETLWNETRGEQRRIHRWLAWMRRKRGRETGILP